MLKEYLVDTLSDYIIEEDSFKVGGKGFVERFIEIFGEELDDNTLVAIENSDIELGPYGTDAVHLEYLEDLQGDIKDFGRNEHDRRKILSYIVSIYNIKGTEESIIRILAAREIKVTAIADVAIVEGRYDETPVLKYDETPVILYDNVCPTCSEITITATKGYAEAVSVDEQALLDQLLELVLPLNTTVKTFTIT